MLVRVKYVLTLEVLKETSWHRAVENRNVPCIHASKKKLNLIFELTCVSHNPCYIGRRQVFSFIITWCFIHFHHGRGI